jgi:aryl-alcohol dehydrogenase-like predicted oxidoreductase
MQYLNLAKDKGLARIVSIQNQYSLINRTYEIGLSEMTMRENISLLAYSPLSMGALTGKYLGGARPAGARFTMFERNSARYNPPRVQEAIEKYVNLAKKHGMDPATLAIAFVTSRKFTTSTIIGATSVAQLKIDIDAGEIMLSKDILEEIEAIYTEYPDPTA